MTHFLVTGTAGFIGFHLARRLLDDGHSVTGFDGMTPYYDVRLKEARLALLTPYEGFRQVTGMLEDRTALEAAAALERPDVIIHLAAQAGVRYSLENPGAYVNSNLVGSWNVLELAKALQPRHLLLASTSSIYGANEKIPFAEGDRADEPMTLYAASKKSMELMAHSYAHLYKVPTTAFRFFTVYGPWGRPDMAYFKFTKAILEGKPIDVYAEAEMSRDFTYVDDISEAIVRLAALPPVADPGFDAASPDPATAAAPYRVYNIGNHTPVRLDRFISVIEQACGKAAIKRHLPMQTGDVRATYADVSDLMARVDFKPDTPIETGIARFVAWYREFYKC